MKFVVDEWRLNQIKDLEEVAYELSRGNYSTRSTRVKNLFEIYELEPMNKADTIEWILYAIGQIITYTIDESERVEE